MRHSFLAVLCLLFSLFSANAALPAFDTAADPAYDSGWTNGSNGGYGFAPWQITTNNDNVSHFAGTCVAR